MKHLSRLFLAHVPIDIVLVNSLDIISSTVQTGPVPHKHVLPVRSC